MAAKRLDIEIARISASLAIIWYHSGVIGGDIAYSGLVVFLIISVYLNQHIQRSAPIGAQIVAKAKRLLVPWGFWFFVYGLVSILRGRSFVLEPNSGIVRNVLIGTSVHLWYLPFLFLVLVVQRMLTQLIPSFALGLAACAFSVFMLLSVESWRAQSMEMGAPWAQWLHASIAVALGVQTVNTQTQPRWIGNALLGIVAFAAIQKVNSIGIGVPYVLGVCMAAWLLNNRSFINVKGDGFLMRASESTLGVYLVHVLGLLVVMRFGFEGSVWLPILTSFGAFGFVMLIRRFFPSVHSIL